MKKTNKLYFIIIMVVTLSYPASYLYKEIYAENNFCNIQVFHILHIAELASCLQSTDKMIMDMHNATNTMIEDKFELLEINQKLIANITQIDIYESLEEYKNTKNTTEIVK